MLDENGAEINQPREKLDLPVNDIIQLVILLQLLSSHLLLPLVGDVRVEIASRKDLEGNNSSSSLSSYQLIPPSILSDRSDENRQQGFPPFLFIVLLPHFSSMLVYSNKKWIPWSLPYISRNQKSNHLLPYLAIGHESLQEARSSHRQ